ncbi:hypothetical protein DJ71_26100 [Halorubrum sp. E3]|nr:hypothetical protein DJ71_26100 [Halorubrum sp. E3]
MLPPQTDVVASRRTGNALAARSGRVGARCWLGSPHAGALSLAPGRALAKARARARRWFCRSLSSENRDVVASRCRRVSAFGTW